MHEIFEFILPIVFSAGEAVIATLILLVLVLIGRGKIFPSERVLVIERKGQYSMILAPGLNLAQPFIEAIAKKIHWREDAYQDCVLCWYEVRDKHVATNKRPCYFLAISLQNNALHFEANFVSQEATLPAPSDMVKLGSIDVIIEDVENGVCSIAKSWSIGVQRIQ